jgi:hypothetical protein
MPANCLYDTFRLKYYHANNNEPFAVSAAHMVNDASIPVHSNFTVRIKPIMKITDAIKNKLLIQRNSKSSIRKASWEGEWLTAQFNDFGIFRAFLDTLSPVLGTPKSFSTKNIDTIDLSAEKNIVFRPNDNFGTIRNFRAELDGNWLRFTNDKGSNYIYSFDERWPYGVHFLKVTIEDLVGNVSTGEWWIKREPYTPPPKKKPAPKKRTTAQKKKKIEL